MATAIELDGKDVLSRFKQEFYQPDGRIYMDGNSLGLMSRRAEAKLVELMHSWKVFGIDGWTEGTHPWFTLAEEMSLQIAPMVGAKPHEVMVTGSITSNIHQMLSTVFLPTSERFAIVVDELNFPSDIYAVESHLRLRGLDPKTAMRKIPSKDGYTLEYEDIVSHLQEDVALLFLPSVLYRSGQLLPIRNITAAAHDKGILTAFDLAHSIGALPHELHKDGVDFAVWCHYKYMNSGPGGTGGLFIHERHHHLEPGHAGWFGSDKAKQFDMDHRFSKAEGAGAYQIGTPNIFSMAPLLGSLEMFEEAGMAAIREKSLKLTAMLRNLIKEQLPEFVDVTPNEDNSRGGHIALAHPEAARICKALKQAGVVPDFRSPNIIRLAPVAFYTSFCDVEETVSRLKNIMQEELYKNFTNERNVVA
ncbi:kynureninase [Planomicrobium sp. CPCC 101079]|uniref:kynureninase n=1 Tax=Planomicrobium sp. CPCC 101079 TaxID=2599618 RepID=UPI0011B490DF|nr:kynureninase [Planomicrobium sp. CPCC 101079]TWT11143.1 kynureninase [Planomicrobium sp. CPCC 101079]